MLRSGPYPIPSTSSASSKTRVLLVDRMCVWWRRRGRRTEERELGQSGHSAHHRACLMTGPPPPQLPHHSALNRKARARVSTQRREEPCKERSWYDTTEHVRL
jgi:hypothetical protein